VLGISKSKRPSPELPHPTIAPIKAIMTGINTKANITYMNKSAIARNSLIQPYKPSKE